jgi:hypothetical protein
MIEPIVQKYRLVQLRFKPDFYDRIRSHCKALDVPITVWARELIRRELEQHP